MSEGTGAWCLDNMVRHKDLMTARERIKGDRDEGKSYKDELREMKCHWWENIQHKIIDPNKSI